MLGCLQIFFRQLQSNCCSSLIMRVFLSYLLNPKNVRYIFQIDYQPLKFKNIPDSLWFFGIITRSNHCYYDARKLSFNFLQPHNPEQCALKHTFFSRYAPSFYRMITRLYWILATLCSTHPISSVEMVVKFSGNPFFILFRAF